MTQITSTIDFDLEGKQVGTLRVPHSVTRSAYGVLPIPVAMVRNGMGPRVLLTAGNHGDEYEGQVVLTRLTQELQADEITGTVIVIPALNLPAVLAATRVSPLDGGNLNRAFPGDPEGGPTWKIAHYVETVLLTMVDVVADFHGGGASLAYRPHASTHFAADASPEHKRRSLDIVSKLGVPHAMVFGGRSKLVGLPDAAIRQKVISLGGEFGGMGNVSRDGIRIVRQAVDRLFACLGVKGELPGDLKPARMMHIFGSDAYVYAPEPGLFEPATELGDFVRTGDLCGYVLFPENPARAAVPVAFNGEGEVVCKRHPGRVEAGDCVAHLAAPLPPQESSGK
ncbi:MAG: succinylglutamate desuccinylase/aspartoacylase family protein [Candidatus Latescibacterota bacterium]|nr:succinylglutamate desuccinylase/aspartoacylase family protein [Candidatus Latescibacterota bacterium]